MTILGHKKRHATDRVAVLYQAVEAPVVNGVRKPRKPGGKSLLRYHTAHSLTQSPQVIEIQVPTYAMFFDKVVTMLSLRSTILSHYRTKAGASKIQRKVIMSTNLGISWHRCVVEPVTCHTLTPERLEGLGY